jgi:crotonobetainyl-CoA:carnitine CoA-transferase CaiB-like acyl-CoA transferase
VEDVVNSPQWRAREYWQEVEHPELGRTFLYPGPFVKFSATPIQYRRRAPLLGEHNAEVYGALGLSAGELALLHGQGIV